MTAQRPDDVTDAEKVDAFGWGLSGYSQHHIVAGIPGSLSTPPIGGQSGEGSEGSLM
jgi:hypothetical protein